MYVLLFHFKLRTLIAWKFLLVASQFYRQAYCPVVDTTCAPSALFLFDLAISVFSSWGSFDLDDRNIQNCGLDKEPIHPGCGVCA